MSPSYIEINKDDILDALEDEPLCAGHWLDYSGCRACAVGSVLRNKVPRLAELQLSSGGFPFADLMARVTDDCYSEERAPAGNYMSALSIVWEHLNREHGRFDDDPLTETEARELILDWADENIPEDYVARIEVPASALPEAPTHA